MEEHSVNLSQGESGEIHLEDGINVVQRQADPVASAGGSVEDCDPSSHPAEREQQQQPNELSALEPCATTDDTAQLTAEQKAAKKAVRRKEYKAASIDKRWERARQVIGCIAPPGASIVCCTYFRKI